LLAFKQDLKILDFDTESRPLSFWYGDKTTSEITAISSAWIDDLGTLQTYLLGHHTAEEMYLQFYDRYNEADLITGHYIRAHDLPLLNSLAIELGLPRLGPKLTCDTKMDLKKKRDIPATQEYLSEVLEVPAPKVHMTQHTWRNANRLSESGIIATKERVAGDVVQHILLRHELLKRDLLHAPKVWRP